ncbi:Uncharacterised protein [BD1-7 clade bacterium]|uniref:Uncharacterized protein n=1 Tax=BD1-7 clade bacterium TaxID=2029982 RepID=A0A5S9PDG7_9GAMM|nr:Uncharacterised protein [BD1-7 clade bacterium]
MLRRVGRRFVRSVGIKKVPVNDALNTSSQLDDLSSHKKREARLVEQPKDLVSDSRGIYGYMPTHES